MRPLHLTLSAFGPFAGVENIPMEKLGQKGIYLITGPTGAGKTTIFDAIVFALYGEASGDVREPQMLRCKQAQGSDATYVQLKFALGDKVYTVKRNPQYQREAKRGGGMTDEKPWAELTLPDGSTIAKTKEVTAKIEELIGLDKNQFSRIAMIAQGDFLKLLLADTKERREVFRKIFGTQGYLELQQKIREDAANEQKHWESLMKKLETLQTQEVDTRYDGSEKIKNLLAELNKSYKEISNQLKKTEAKVDDLRVVNEKNRTAAKLLLELEKNKQQEKIVEKALVLLNKKNKSMPFLSNRIQALTEKNAMDKEKLGQYTDLNQAQKEHMNIMAEFKLLTVELSTEKKAEISRKQAVVQGKEKLVSMGKLEVQISENQRSISENSQREKLIIGVDLAAKEYTAIRLHCAREKENFLQLQEKYSLAQTSAKSGELLFLKGQAGVLAASLKTGEPCPVCGSTAHPSKAKPTNQAPTENQLEQLKVAEAAAMSALRQKAEECAGLNAKKQQYKENVLEKINGVFGDTPLEKIKESIASELEKCSEYTTKLINKQRELEAAVVKSKKIEKEIANGEAELEKNSKRILELTERLAVAKTYGESLGEKIIQLKKGLEFESLSLAKIALEKTEADLARSKAAADNIVSSVKEKQQEMAGLSAGRNAFSKQLAELGQCPNVERELEEQAKIRSELGEKSKVGFARIQQYNSLLEKVQETEKEIEGRRGKLGWLTALADTATGSVKGKQRINFETYVQINYFEMVIRAANQRFIKMTDGRYELKRKEEVDSLKEQTGLELNVLDKLNGVVRNVKTLSGGESFKASLALALGLSDVVQFHAGGVKIHTMFVDEGFGSLDAQSLDLAVEALSKLSKSGVLVGIISHVAELKERIEKRIVVTPGSEIRVE